MKSCLMCNRELSTNLTLKQIFCFEAYQDPLICEKCRHAFRPIAKKTACPGCSRPQTTAQDCNDCKKWKARVADELVAHEALFYYDDALKSWLQRYKFIGDTRFAEIMSPAIKAQVKKYPEAIIVPIPVSELSYARRGFNQCEELLRVADVPYKNWLENISIEKKQSEKNRQERLQMAQPFHIHPSFEIHTPVIFLFDDVYTTGRTLMHAKQLFAQTGITKIHSFSIGR